MLTLLVKSPSCFQLCDGGEFPKLPPLRGEIRMRNYLMCLYKNELEKLDLRNEKHVLDVFMYVLCFSFITSLISDVKMF